jgi:hypothetical protein
VIAFEQGRRDQKHHLIVEEPVLEFFGRRFADLLFGVTEVSGRKPSTLRDMAGKVNRYGATG